MSRAPQISLLPDGRRLHLQDGPVDLVIGVSGPQDVREDAFGLAVARFYGLLDQLCDEIGLLRAPAPPAVCPRGPVAQRMLRAVLPFARESFITPMAAVAGSVADEILSAMRAAGGIERAYVNNGGDIAILLAPGQTFTAGMVDRPDHPRFFGRTTLIGGDGAGGLATSGWRGRSFSLGIADAVTVLARNAAMADAAATLIANAVDLPGHKAITRVPANSIQADSDLGARLVTRAVGVLDADETGEALMAGLSCARNFLDRGLIMGAALHLQGVTRVARAAGIDPFTVSPPMVWQKTNAKVAAHA